MQVEDITEDALTARNGVKFAKEVQRLQGLGDDDEAKDTKNEDENHRFTVMDLERNSKKEKQDGSLAMAFEKRYMSMDLNAQGTHFFYHIGAREWNLIIPSCKNGLYVKNLLNAQLLLQAEQYCGPGFHYQSQIANQIKYQLCA